MGNLDTGIHVEDEGRDQGDVSKSQGMQNWPANHQKPAETEHILPHTPQKEPTLWRNRETIHFCCLNHLVCRTLLYQQTNTFLRNVI